VVVGDVFHDVAIPQHLVTREFAGLVAARLAEDGLYAMNVVDTFPDPRLIKAMIKTLGSEFSHVDVWMEGMPDASRVTYVLTASNAMRLPAAVRARWGLQRRWLRVTERLTAIGTPPDRLPVLTDDFAPVERLIGPLLTGEDG
jgi:spermidine synthase